MNLLVVIVLILLAVLVLTWAVYLTLIAQFLHVRRSNNKRNDRLDATLTRTLDILHYLKWRNTH
jgi:archaellum component FlaF (FlaF/FlaG flagellin family)